MIEIRNDNFLLIFPFQNTQHEAVCYESLEDYGYVRKYAKFWLEGVSILVIGIFGLCGNFLSIFILRRSQGNKGFNTLLIM